MYKRIINKVKNIPLSGKMLLLHAVLLTFACIIVVIAMQICLNIYDEKLYEKSLQELDFFVQQVNNSLEDITTTSYNVAMDMQIQEHLSAMQKLDAESAAYYYEMNRLYAPLIYKTANDNLIKNVIYYDQYGNSIKAGMECGTIDQNGVELLLEEAGSARGACVMYSPTQDYPYLLAARDIHQYHDYSMDYLGTYIFTCDVSGLIEKNIKSLSAPHSNLFVYSENGILIYQSDKDAPFVPKAAGDQGWSVEKVRGQRYFVCYLEAGNGWRYVNLFPYTDIFGQVTKLRYAVLIAFFAVFILSIWLMQLLSNTITKPIAELSQSMRVVETGDFEKAKSLLTTDTSEDETGALTKEFSVMLDKITVLIRENYEKQLLLQDTRYRMLQAQINPHFLYNTLNTVGWMVQANKNEDAFEMLVNLGMLLRYALNKSPSTTVADEVEMLKSYVAIQQMRYLNKAELKVEVQGDLVGWCMPRMILQPLVENSLYHGLDDMPQGGRVSVAVREERDSVVFLVEDNGKGIPSERLESIRNNTYEFNDHGIGLRNIRERLEMTFSHSRFEIDSVPGHGTAVMIEIPKVMEVFSNAEASDS